MGTLHVLLSIQASWTAGPDILTTTMLLLQLYSAIKVLPFKTNLVLTTDILDY